MLTVVAFSCSNNNLVTKTSNKSVSDTTSYPKQDYSRVTLFTLDSSQKIWLHSDSGETFIDSSSFETVGYAGVSFVDTTGVPKTRKIKSYTLDSTQIKKLRNFLDQQPCTDSLYMDKNCFSIYRDVFVFYDESKKPIAQIHICFECERSAFNPYADRMCDFDNKVNWKAFKSFVDSIKN